VEVVARPGLRDDEGQLEFLAIVSVAASATRLDAEIRARAAQLHAARHRLGVETLRGAVRAVSDSRVPQTAPLATRATPDARANPPGVFRRWQKSSPRGHGVLGLERAVCRCAVDGVPVARGVSS
jgi:hypothetical protein